MQDGSFTLSYAVKGTDATGVDTGEPGTYTATGTEITFVDSGGWRTTADWELSEDELRLSVGDDVAHEFISGVPWKWYVSYMMSEPFTKVA